VADQRSSANGAVQNSSPAVAPALSVAEGLVIVLGVDGSVCTAILVSLYIYIYTYTHTHIYIYIFFLSWFGSSDTVLGAFCFVELGVALAASSYAGGDTQMDLLSL
jgi:hypothetical protein